MAWGANNVDKFDVLEMCALFAPRSATFTLLCLTADPGPCLAMNIFLADLRDADDE